MRKVTHFNNRKWKPTTLLVSILLLACIAVGGTLAFLIAQAGPVVNTFQPSKVATEVEETLVGNTKTDVKIKNTGDTNAYIRAAVVVTWKDADGNVCGQAPVAGTDYNIVFATDTGWTKSADGFYYYTTPVVSKGETGILITSCSPVADKAPEGYSLDVMILGSGIQSVPTDVVTQVWGSGVSSVDNNDTLTIKTN